MRSLVQTGYGSPGEVLSFAEIEHPRIGPNDVLIRTCASGVGKGIWLITQGLPLIARPAYGLRKPKHQVPGLQFSGVVQKCGAGVSGVAPGDAVFGFCTSAFAEFISVPQDALVPKPASITFEQAAVVPISGLAALQAVRDSGKVEPGHRVLVIGASGSVGSFATQIAKARGAAVSAVAGTRNLAMVEELGADVVIDYTRNDPVDGSVKYDVILDIAGNRPVSRLRRALERNGTLVIVGGTGGRLTMGFERTIGGVLMGSFLRPRVVALFSNANLHDLEELADLLTSGKVRPVVNPVVPFNRAIEAIDAAGSGHGAGTPVVTFTPSSGT